MPHMLGVDIATTLARSRNYFARVTASGRRLVFYTGREDDPGTWLEAGSTLITDGQISRNAFELICTEPK
jgi:hypothetical protein